MFKFEIKYSLMIIDEGKSQGWMLSSALYSCFIKWTNKSKEKISTLLMNVLHTNENILLKNSRRQDVCD